MQNENLQVINRCFDDWHLDELLASKLLLQYL